VSSRLSYIDITVWAQWKEDQAPGKSWGISLELCEQINSDILLSRIAKCKIPREETIRLVKEKLDPNSDVAMTSLRVNLLCPVGCSRMTTPTRTKKCNHLQCFDSSLYLKMNEKKPTWKCPVCDNEAYFTDLIVDEYFIEICRESSTDEVDFYESGGWKEHHVTKDKSRDREQIKEKKKEKQVVLHSVTLVDSDDDVPVASTRLAPPTSTEGPSGLSKSNDDACIILSSDDEDIQPQPKRARLDQIGAESRDQSSSNQFVPNPRATPDLLQGHHQAGSMSHGGSMSHPFVTGRGTTSHKSLTDSSRSATQGTAAAPTTSAATTASPNPLATFDSILGMSDQRQLELGMTSSYDSPYDSFFQL
jgi:hypothetical protein